MTTGEVIAGKYRLSGMLAHGGMGSVWRARHLLLDVDVAVKLMAPTLATSADQRARFAREAKAAAQIKSPHVVQIHDYGLDGDTPYIVMELLEGEDLGARLRREKRLTPAIAATILTQLGRGLRKAHDMGIVHRDIKPANIFFARGDDDEVVKLLDFGIARAMTSTATGETTNTGEIIGSPPYMSPEQVRGQKSLDHRTDQWSLGVVLYRMLTGRLPFQSDQAGDLLVKICTEDAPPPSSHTLELAPEIDRFFARVFQRDPGARFASVRALVEAFTEAVALDPPVRAALASVSDATPFVSVRTTVRMEPGPQPRVIVNSPVPPSAPVVSPPSSAPVVALPASVPVVSPGLRSMPVVPLTSPSSAPVTQPLPSSAPVVPSMTSAPVTQPIVYDAPAVTIAGTSTSGPSGEASTLTSGVATVPMRSPVQRGRSPWAMGALVTMLVGGGAAIALWFGAFNHAMEAEATPASTAAPLVSLPEASQSAGTLAAEPPVVVSAPAELPSPTAVSTDGPAPTAPSPASSGVAAGATAAPPPEPVAAEPVAPEPAPPAASASVAAVLPTSPPSGPPVTVAPSPKATPAPRKEKHIPWD
jgi:eukaryotic-like serine/threonine-protein kinase